MSTIPSSIANLDDKTLERFRECVQAEVVYESPEEEQCCFGVVDGLSEDEVKATAEISYAYWVLSKLEDPIVTPELTRKMAAKVSRWHVQFLGVSTPEKAIERVQDCLDFREELNLDLYRTCFDKDPANPTATPEEIEALKKDITDDINNEPQLVIGVDKEGRAITIVLPRKDGDDADAYYKKGLYAAERAIAATEFVSKGKKDTMCCLYYVPGAVDKFSFSVKREGMKRLQALYPARMGKAIVIEAPFMVRQAFNMIKPFLFKRLRESTDLVAGSTIQTTLAEYLEDPNILTPEGELVKPVDISKYLNETPFYTPYGYTF